MTRIPSRAFWITWSPCCAFLKWRQYTTAGGSSNLCLTPGVVEDDVELGSLQPGKFAFGTVGAKPMLLALAGEEVRIPGKLPGHVRGGFRSATVKGVEEGHGSRPAKPVTRIVEVGLASVHHAVPVRDEVAR